MAAATILSRSFAVGIGEACRFPTALPCLQSGVFLVAGGLPRSLAWQVQPAPITDSQRRTAFQQFPILSLLPEGLTPATPLVVASCGDVQQLPMPIGISAEDELAALGLADEQIMSEGGPVADEIAASLSATEAPLPELAETHFKDTPRCGISSTIGGGLDSELEAIPVNQVQPRKKRSGQLHRLQTHRNAAVLEIASLRSQRLRHALAAMSRDSRRHQQVALRAWAQEAARARQTAVHRKDLEEAVAQATAALRRQYHMRRASWRLQQTRQARSNSFKAWVVATQQAVKTMPQITEDDTPVASVPVATSDLSIAHFHRSQESVGSVCPCDLGGAWGCACHRVYSGGLLLAHRQVAQLAIQGPPGLEPIPLPRGLGLRAVFPEVAIQARQLRSKPCAMKKANVRLSNVRGRETLLATVQPVIEAPNSAQTPVEVRSTRPRLCALEGVDEVDFHVQPRGAWA